MCRSTVPDRTKCRLLLGLWATKWPVEVAMLRVHAPFGHLTRRQTTVVHDARQGEEMWGIWGEGEMSEMILRNSGPAPSPKTGEI